MRLILAIFTAVSVPCLLITGWYLYGQFQMFDANDPYIWVRTSKWLVLSFIVSFLYVLILGLPAYFLLKRFNLVQLWSTSLAGFFLGVLPAAFATWPLRYSDMKTNASVNGVETIINGIPTTAGWINFLEGIAFFGMFGCISAMAFWLVIGNKV